MPPMRLLLMCLTALLAIALLGCPPSLNRDERRFEDDDDSGAKVDDDDTTSSHDPCCDTDGDSETWRDCIDQGAMECVCEIDSYCCEDAWDGTCQGLYLSPCGSLTCID